MSPQKIRRYQLNDKLEAVIESKNVYFEPPASVKLKYPCIIYHRSDTRSIKADDIHYHNTPSYDVIHITKDPDTDIVQDMLDAFERCFHNRRYTSENLIHDSFTLYY